MDDTRGGRSAGLVNLIAVRADGSRLNRGAAVKDLQLHVSTWWAGKIKVRAGRRSAVTPEGLPGAPARSSTDESLPMKTNGAATIGKFTAASPAT